MSEYKHGNWFCKPANEAEAKEIMDRAVASGAKMLIRWSPDDKAFGVYDGVVSWDEEVGTRYTISKLREKFPLPGEDVKTGFSSEGFPTVGWHGECSSDKHEWFECVVLPDGFIACANKNGRWWQIYSCELLALQFRQLRTEREKFIEAAKRIACKDFTESQAMFAAGEIYDALQSGELKAPEVKK